MNNPYKECYEQMTKVANQNYSDLCDACVILRKASIYLGYHHPTYKEIAIFLDTMGFREEGGD